MNISKNAAAIIGLILSLLGLQIGEDTIVELITALTTVFTIGVMIYNQFKRPDVEDFLWKKK